MTAHPLVRVVVDYIPTGEACEACALPMERGDVVTYTGHGTHFCVECATR